MLDFFILDATLVNSSDNTIWRRLLTDLGSLIGIFDFGYATVWKFSNFPGTLILREIDFGWFQKIKMFRLNIEQQSLRVWILIFGKTSHLKCQKFLEILTSELLKWSKWQFLTFWRQTKLISRKIWVVGKLLNFHTVGCKSKNFPLRQILREIDFT